MANNDRELSTAGKRYKVLTYDQYMARGRQVKAFIDMNPALDKTVMPLGQSRTKNSEYSNIRDGYDRKDNEVESCKTCDEPENRENYTDALPFTEVGLSNEIIIVRRCWVTRNKGRKSEFNHSFYNAEFGVIIIDDMRSGATEGKAIRSTIPASELTWQSWKEIAGEANKKNLKMCFQHRIANEGTMSIIEQGYAKQTPPLHQLAEGHFFMGGGDSKKQEVFLALLGSDNARPTEYMLKDHFNEIGQKKIQQISIFPYDNDNSYVGWNMVISIGKDSENPV